MSLSPPHENDQVPVRSEIKIAVTETQRVSESSVHPLDLKAMPIRMQISFCFSKDNASILSPGRYLSQQYHLLIFDDTLKYGPRSTAVAHSLQ